MKKIFFGLVILMSLVFLTLRAGGFSFNEVGNQDQNTRSPAPKTPILKFALVADSENDNDLLVKALDQAKSSGVSFVIGLGDWSAVGTLAELTRVKKIFDDSELKYYLTPGDHDLWDSRNQGRDALLNYEQIFGSPSAEFEKEGIDFVIVDNSDIYRGIDAESLKQFAESLKKPSKLRFVFAHKTPFHPTSSHVMGEDSAQVAKQAKEFMDVMEKNKVDGFFSGDLHFFAQFKSPNDAVRITTIGAVERERNFQGPRFAEVTVWSDYSWEVTDREIR